MDQGRAEIIGEKSEIPCKADDVASTPILVSCKGYSDMLQGSIDRVYKPMIFGVTDLFQPVPGLADDPADPSGKNQILSAWGLGPGFYQKLPRCRGGHAEGDTADHSKIALPGPQVGFRAPQGMKHIVEDEGVIIKFRREAGSGGEGRSSLPADCERAVGSAGAQATSSLTFRGFLVGCILGGGVAAALLLLVRIIL